MANYLRDHMPGGTWFFTVVTHQRKAILCLDEYRTSLRAAVVKTRKKHPFEIKAWVLLPDHFHCILTLPANDAAYSLRISLIKRFVSQSFPVQFLAPSRLPASRTKRNESGIWQRRFWEHRIRDERDLQNHLDYVHYNPVKHGHALAPKAWPYSSFHRYVSSGLYLENWALSENRVDELSHGAGE